MPDIWTNIVAAAHAMTWLEVVATVFSAVCVFLAVKRKVISYPIGIVGTIAFFFVFWRIGLYSSAMLQVFFTAVQVYGWWFWLKGDKGAKPLITRVNRNWIIGGVAAALIGGFGLSLITGALGAKMALADAGIFGLSVVAQFFLDRKKLENWIVWIGVNVISIYVYGSQGLALTTLLYVIFLVNAFYGYWEWRKAFRSQTTNIPLAKIDPRDLRGTPIPAKEDSPTLSLVQTMIQDKPVDNVIPLKAVRKRGPAKTTEGATPKPRAPRKPKPKTDG